MSSRSSMPETKVLAIASHFMGNHTAYKQVGGTKVTAAEIKDLYAGLQKSHLIDFDVLLSGYAPGSQAVEAVGEIAKDLKTQNEKCARPLFWVMDPVMGDNGQLYVDQDVVPAYKALLPHADLILPNQFEAEVLSEIKITDLSSLIQAISTLHSRYKIPHIIVTSVRFPFDTSTSDAPKLSIIGSTIRSSDSTPRLFRISVPDIDAFFSGTGDMFAALMVARLREISSRDGLCKDLNRSAWLCADDVLPLDTPLARAAEVVCASVSIILAKTKQCMDDELTGVHDDGGMEYHLRKTKAAEVRVVKFQEDLKNPTVIYCAEEVVLS